LAAAQPVQEQNTGVATLVQDSFTLSSQSISNQATAQDAGLFQVSQFALSAAAADILSAQTASAQATQSTAQVQAATPPLSPPPQVATIAIAADTANTRDELQFLNGVLLGLGLSNSDIQNIDRIASMTNLYSPRLYTDLVEQIKAQAALQATLAVAGRTPATQPEAVAPYKAARRIESSRSTAVVSDRSYQTRNSSIVI
jgi:hypothetical protein